MQFNDALRYLYSFINFERVPGAMRVPLARNVNGFREFLGLLGNPQHRFPSVLVAGTNGKGSVSRVLAGIVTAAGRRAGLFTSPHLCSVRERFNVGGIPISPEDFARHMTALRAAMERRNGHASQTADPTGFRTTFELMTALALLHFAETEVDLAVLEVGLGGRLDTTNAVDPVCSVITHIAFDHTEVLGNTLTLIAREKAGIMRTGLPVIIGPQEPEALAALLASAGETGARPITLQEAADIPLERVSLAERRQFFTWRGQSWETPLLGAHQRCNVAVAIEAARHLPLRGFPPPDATIREGVGRSTWPGRLHVLAPGWTIPGGEGPLLIADGAHNPDGAASLAHAREELFPGKPVCFVASFSTKKKPFEILSRLLRPEDDWVLFLRSGVRALPEKWFLENLPPEWTLPPRFREIAGWCEILPAREGGWPVVCFTGSLFFVGDVLHHFEGWERDEVE